MRKRIQALANDQFTAQAPVVDCRPASIRVESPAGSFVTGSFEVASANEIPLRGLVYSTNPYVVCTQPQFAGLKVKIAYEVNVPGAKGGEVMDGAFVIVCSQCVARIPYEFSFESVPLTSSRGNLETLSDFADLAREQWEEALRMFFTDGFASWISQFDQRTRLLYQGYRRGLLSSRNLEEFLVAAGLKSRITCDIPEETRRYEFIYEDRRESIDIARSGWGYLDLSVESDASFIEVEPPEISAEQFMGSSFQSYFYLRADRMHPGQNYGRIRFTSGGQTRVITIIACSGAMDDWPKEKEHDSRTLILRAFRDYESYRLGRMGVSEWTKRWIRDLNAVSARSGSLDVWCRLLSAMAVLENGQNENALWIITDLRKDITDHNSAEWAFLLYLWSRLEKKKSAYSEKMTAEILSICQRHPQDLRLFWIELQVRQDWKEDSALKYHAIEQQLVAGRISPLLHLEAYEILVKYPYLLGSLDKVPFLLLEWIRRRRAFTADIAIRLAEVADTGAAADRRRILTLLKSAYEAFPERILLEKIVALMLSLHQYGEEYLIWYRRAIDAEIRMTGIYEAYLMSVPQANVEPLPRVVTRFFHLQSTLPAEKYAVLYANIVSARKKDPDTYEMYLPVIDSFIAEQMHQGRIDENLALLYQDFLRRTEPDVQVCEEMAPLLFIHKVSSRLPRLSRVYVCHEQLSGTVMAAARDGAAHLPLYTADAAVFLEDASGNLVADRDAMYVESLFDVESLYQRMQPRIPEALPYLVRAMSAYAGYRISMKDLPPKAEKKKKKAASGYVSEKAVKEEGLTRKKEVQAAPETEEEPKAVTAADPGLRMITQMLASRQISDEEKTAWYPTIIAYLRSIGREDLIQSHFATLTELDPFTPELRSYVLAAWIGSGQYHKAFVCLRRFPGTLVEERALESLFSHLVNVNGAEWSDDFMLSWCGRLLDSGIHDAQLAQYLCLHYIGPTGRMMRLWEAQKDPAAPYAMALAERILVQMLFAEDFSVPSGSVFPAFCAGGGNSMVIAAWKNYWAHLYLVSPGQRTIDVFPQIFADIAAKKEVSDSCRYALMKRLATAATITDGEFEILDDLIRTAIASRVYFAFFRRMDRRLILKYQLYDKFYVEYYSEPGQRMIISWKQSDGTLREEEMLQAYPGIYVHEFVLFYGQELDYRLFDAEDRTKVCREDSIRFSGMLRPGTASRYDLLCRASEELERANTGRASQILEEYREKDRIAREFFEVL